MQHHDARIHYAAPLPCCWWEGRARGNYVPCLLTPQYPGERILGWRAKDESVLSRLSTNYIAANVCCQTSCNYNRACRVFISNQSRVSFPRVRARATLRTHIGNGHPFWPADRSLSIFRPFSIVLFFRFRFSSTSLSVVTLFLSPYVTLITRQGDRSAINEKRRLDAEVEIYTIRFDPRVGVSVIDSILDSVNAECGNEESCELDAVN